MHVREQYVTARDRIYDGVNPREWITVHETDNRAVGADAAAHANLQSSGNVRNASWHEQVDEREAVISFPPQAQCWHAGDGEGPGNLTSYVFELCVNADGDYDQALANLAARVRQRRKDFGLGRDRVVQHDHWSGKNCPRLLRGMGPEAWAAFVASTDPEEETSMSDVLISPFEGRLTSGWGWREILGRPLTFHRGQDIAPPIAGTRGLPVFAPCDLDIIYVSEGTYSKAQGKWLGNDYTSTWNTGPVVIARGRGKWSGYWFLFGHMAGIKVTASQKVTAGHVLGLADDKGNVQGVHLHFEIWTSSQQGGGNAAGNTIDPVAFYARHGVRLGSAPALDKTPTSPIREDWLDMATEAQVRTIIREELASLRDRAEKTNQAVGRLDIAVPKIADGITALAGSVAEVKDDTRRLPHISDRAEKTNQAVGRLELVLPRIADKVGAPSSSTPADIAAAIAAALPRELAQQVADELGNRLTRKA